MGPRQTVAACLAMVLLTAMCLSVAVSGRAYAQAPAVVGGDEREEETPRVLSLLMARREGVLRAELSRHRAQVLIAGTSQGFHAFEVSRYGTQHDVRSAAYSP